MVQCLAREQRHLDIDEGDVARAQRHPHGAGDALRIEQAVNHQRAHGGARTLDPERPEEGQFLAARLARAQNQRTRHRAEILAARQGAEEGAALEDRDLEGAFQPGRDPHARELQVGIARRRCDTPIVELATIEADAAHRAILDREQADGIREDEAAMQRLEREAAILAGPDRGARLHPNPGILIRGQGGVALRQVVRGQRNQRALGQGPGGIDDCRGVETLSVHERGDIEGSRARRGLCRGRPGQREQRCAASGAFQKLPTIQGFRHGIHTTRATPSPFALLEHFQFA